VSTVQRSALHGGVLAVGFAALLLDALAPVPALRALITLVAALSLPGTALTARTSFDGPREALAVIVGLSLAVEIVLALAMAWTGWWHPAAVAVGLFAASGAAIAAARLRPPRRRLGASS